MQLFELFWIFFMQLLPDFFKLLMCGYVVPAVCIYTLSQPSSVPMRVQMLEDWGTFVAVCDMVINERIIP